MSKMKEVWREVQTREQLEAMRPGCQDFLDCPSLKDGKRIPYSPPKADCVGKLADPRNLAGD